MVLRFLILASIFLFVSCYERDNFDDPNGTNFRGTAIPSSSSVQTQEGKIPGEPPYVFYDGQVYETVVIGTQTWMAKNLIYNGKENISWSTAISACPSGWHLPSIEEYRTLFDFAGYATKLKATSGWDANGAENGVDIYGFSALPNPNRSSSNVGDWWSRDSDNYYKYYCYIQRETMGCLSNDPGYMGYSSEKGVRCLQD